MYLGSILQKAGIIKRFNGIVINNTNNPKLKGPPFVIIILIDNGKKYKMFNAKFNTAIILLTSFIFLKLIVEFCVLND